MRQGALGQQASASPQRHPGASAPPPAASKLGSAGTRLPNGGGAARTRRRPYAQQDAQAVQAFVVAGDPLGIDPNLLAQPAQNAANEASELTPMSE